MCVLFLPQFCIPLCSSSQFLVPFTDVLKGYLHLWSFTFQSLLISLLFISISITSLTFLWLNRVFDTTSLKKFSLLLQETEVLWKLLLPGSVLSPFLKCCSLKSPLFSFGTFSLGNLILFTPRVSAASHSLAQI